MHGYRLPREALNRWVAKLAALPPEALGRLPGLDPERAPVILAGAAILAFLTEWVGAQALLVSTWDLMAGLLVADGAAGA